jgi:cytoskeleton protein RodZ
MLSPSSTFFGKNEPSVLHLKKSSLTERRALMSSADDGFDGSVATAIRVGADLRTARERLGWALPDLSAHLRIRLPFLQALEDGHTDQLPGTAYAVGFLRTYAQSLGLDADEMARRFRDDTAEANLKTELKFPAPVPERGMPAGAVVLLGALLLIGSYAGWYRMSEHGHSAVDGVAAVPARLAPLAAPLVDRIAPAEPAPADSAGASPAVTPAAPHSDPAPTPTNASPLQAYAGVPAAPVSTPQLSTATATATPPPSGSPLTNAATPAPAPAVIAGGTRIVVRAKAEAWVQVRERDGAVLLNRVLRPAETWMVPDKPALLLTTGNAGGTELLVDGTVTASLGAEGAVRRDLPLDADTLKTAKTLVMPKRP